MSGSVLVAGGTGALGVAVVQVLLDAGWRVTATWVAPEDRDRAARTLGDEPRLRLVEADLFDPAAADELVAATDELAAVVDLVGGYAGGALVHETDPEAFERMLRLNLRPAFLLARAALPRLVARGGGAFVATSARAAVRPFPGAAGYVTAKAAVLAFVQALDAEYRKDGVRANAILPNVIDTPANRAARPGADYSTWVQPVEIARVIRHLVSDDAAVTSGAAVPVYGRS